MNAGFSLVLIAETYCQGDILVGPPLTPAQLLDSAIVRFKQAVAIGGASGVAEGTKVVNASNVGLARASLQKKDYLRARGFLQRYEKSGPPTPETLWIGAQTESALGDTAAAQEYANRLREQFPESDESSRSPEAPPS